MLGPDIPDIHSADGYPAAALRYIVELVQKKHQRALSGTGSSEDAQGGSRRYLYIYILQYVMTLFIAEGYVLETDVSRHVIVSCSRTIVFLFGIHDVGKSVKGNSRLGHLGKHPSEPPYGETQHAVIRYEGHVFAGSHLTFNCENRSEYRHQQDLETAKNILNGEELAYDVTHVHPEAAVVVVLFFEALLLQLFVCEGADHPDSRQVLLNYVGDESLVLIALLESSVHLLSEDH